MSTTPAASLFTASANGFITVTKVCSLSGVNTANLSLVACAAASTATSWLHAAANAAQSTAFFM